MRICSFKRPINTACLRSGEWVGSENEIKIERGGRGEERRGEKEEKRGEERKKRREELHARSAPPEMGRGRREERGPTSGSRSAGTVIYNKRVLGWIANQT